MRILRSILPSAFTVIVLLICLMPVAQAQESYAPPHKVGGELWLVGTVEDRAGAPLAGLVIALWQGDESGRYAHPDWAAAGPLREDFQYFGSATSDAAGNFVFRSRVPGATALGPARLHLEIQRAGETLLNTQLYFPEDHLAIFGEYVYGESEWGNEEMQFMQDVALACDSAEAKESTRILYAPLVLDRGAGDLTPTPALALAPPYADFYPDRDFSHYDNDLLDANPQQQPLSASNIPEIPAGRVGDGLWLISEISDRAGDALAGMVFEFWQADEHGAHDHPIALENHELRDDFQYFGVAHTDEHGLAVFRTRQPYTPGHRPKHLHFIVKQGDEELLVSQFFFPEDIAYVLRDRFYLERSHGDDELLFLRDINEDCATRAGADREQFRVMEGLVVLRLGEGPRAPTPALDTGRFYPIVDFSEYDNDLLDARPHQQRLTIADAPLPAAGAQPSTDEDP